MSNKNNITPITTTIGSITPTWESTTSISSGSYSAPIFEVKSTEEELINLLWKPKKDITVYELAKATPFIPSHRIVCGVECVKFDELESEVKRHFVIAADSYTAWANYVKGRNINILQKKL